MTGNWRVQVSSPDDPLEFLQANIQWEYATEAVLSFDYLPNEVPAWLGKDRIERLIISSPEPGTLLNLVRMTLNSGSTFLCVYKVALALFGRSTPLDEPVINILEVHVAGCSTWFGKRGLQEISGSISQGHFAVKYDQPETITWSLGTGLSLSYWLHLDTTIVRIPRSALHLVEDSVLTLKQIEQKPIYEMLRLLTKALAFIEFATNETIEIERAMGCDSNIEDSVCDIGAAWKRDRKPRIGLNWLVQFSTIQNQFEGCLGKWLEIYDQLPLALDSYRVCKQSSSLQVEFKLFSIISALESYHRTYLENRVNRINSRENLTLKNRLQEIVSYLGNMTTTLVELSDCEKIATTRNYLAHQTPSLRNKSIDQSEWFYWFRKLQVMFEFCILSELPLDKNVQESIINQQLQRINSGYLGEWNL